MSDDKIKKCPKCGQKLRIPGHIGGIVMVCPMCKEKIHSDFRIGQEKSQLPTVRQPTKKNILIDIFEMPGKLLDALVHLFSK